MTRFRTIGKSSQRHPSKENTWAGIPEPRRKAIGQKIKSVREGRGWSYQDVADKTGMSMVTVKNIEAGRFATQVQVFILSYLSHLGVSKESVGLK